MIGTSYQKEAFIEELTAVSRKYRLYLDVSPDEALVVREAPSDLDLSSYGYILDEDCGWEGDLLWGRCLTKEPSGLLCGYYVEQDKEPLTAKYKGEGSYESSNKNS